MIGKFMPLKYTLFFCGAAELFLVCILEIGLLLSRSSPSILVMVSFWPEMTTMRIISNNPIPESKAGIKYDFFDDCACVSGLRDGSNVVLSIVVLLSSVVGISAAALTC